jgi:hypothetical protein
MLLRRYYRFLVVTLYSQVATKSLDTYCIPHAEEGGRNFSETLLPLNQNRRYYITEDSNCAGLRYKTLRFPVRGGLLYWVLGGNTNGIYAESKRRSVNWMK